MKHVVMINTNKMCDFINFLMEHKKLNKYEKPFYTRYVVEDMNFSDLFIDRYINHKEIKYINDYSISPKAYIEWFDYGDMFDFFENHVINEIERRVELFKEE